MRKTREALPLQQKVIDLKEKGGSRALSIPSRSTIATPLGELSNTLAEIAELSKMTSPNEGRVTTADVSVLVDTAIELMAGGTQVLKAGLPLIQAQIEVTNASTLEEVVRKIIDVNRVLVTHGDGQTRYLGGIVTRRTHASLNRSIFQPPLKAARKIVETFPPSLNELTSLRKKYHHEGNRIRTKVNAFPELQFDPDLHGNTLAEFLRNKGDAENSLAGAVASFASLFDKTGNIPDRLHDIKAQFNRARALTVATMESAEAAATSMKVVGTDILKEISLDNAGLDWASKTWALECQMVMMGLIAETPAIYWRILMQMLLQAQMEIVSQLFSNHSPEEQIRLDLEQILVDANTEATKARDRQRGRRDKISAISKNRLLQ